MFRSLPMFGAILALCILVWPGAARAVYPPAIKDDGKFFSKEALEKANRKIRELYEKYRKDVVIETIPELTEEQQKKLKTESGTKFWGSYALARERELGVNGLYFVISKNPRHIEIFADTDSRKTVFTNEKRKTILNKVIESFKAGKFDAGLLGGLDAVEATLKAGAK